MSLTTRVLIALVAGLGGGVAISFSESVGLSTLVSFVEPIGALWVNAIRMTVVPLVVSLLITGIASNTPKRMGQVGGRSLALFVALVAAGAVFVAVVAPPLLSLATFDPEAFSALRESVPSVEAELPPVREWVVGLIPSNPLRAAADGAMLPLIVFSVITALAMTTIGEAHRSTLLRLLSAVSRVMFVIVDWILIVAPIGVFCLVLPLAASTGVDLVGALSFFLVIVCGLLVVATVALYPVATIVGGVPLRTFARACAPVQALAFSTRSSLATLPVMLESADRYLQLPERVSGVVLPVAISLFKYASPVARITGTFFVAHLYGVDLGIVEISTITAAVAGLSFYSPGIPSGGLFIMTPIYIALGLPVEGVGLLIALDLIPDMFITVGNTTADMAAAVIIARFDSDEASPSTTE
jgi:Na+/H+-dicarboxylate symporter